MGPYWAIPGKHDAICVISAIWGQAKPYDVIRVIMGPYGSIWAILAHM